jgi:hypothetical protein
MGGDAAMTMITALAPLAQREGDHAAENGAAAASPSSSR